MQMNRTFYSTIETHKKEWGGGLMADALNSSSHSTYTKMHFEINLVRFQFKGGLISESFSFWHKSLNKGVISLLNTLHKSKSAKE